MKNYTLQLKRFTLAAICLTFIMLQSCSKKIAFQTSPVVPAARGTVKVTKDDNKNYHIAINLINLAEISRVYPDKKMYVVWMVATDNSTKNLGMINSSSGFMSTKLKANFQTNTASKPVKIFITAETDGDTRTPGTSVLLTTNDF